jgi:hypothetical protein
VRQLVRDYQAGVSANQLATRYQLSRSSIRRLLRESGTPRRYQAMIDAEVNQAVELYQSGLTIAQVAAKLNRPWSTVQTALTRRDVARRSWHDYRPTHYLLPDDPGDRGRIWLRLHPHSEICGTGPARHTPSLFRNPQVIPR